MRKGYQPRRRREGGLFPLFLGILISAVFALWLLFKRSKDKKV
ncbi:MAG: hypothetical protein QXF24_07075 [Thermoproteota archaeon]